MAECRACSVLRQGDMESTGRTFTLPNLACHTKSTVAATAVRSALTRVTGFLLCPLVVLLLNSPVIAAPAEKNLAKVAILTYEDETSTKNFGYMPNSLTEAIDKSLQKKFEYEREDPKKSEAARKLIKPKGAFTAKEAAAYCTKNDVQILVFGKFTYDAANRQIVVETVISLGSEEKFRKLKERTNPTDATIFALADKVADDIVAEMTAIAKEQQEKEGKAKEQKTGEKLELKKDTAITWAPKKNTANVAFGVIGPSGDLKDAYDDAGTLTLSANRLLWKGFYAGVFTQFFKLSTKSGNSVFLSSLTALPLTANIGYSLFFWSDRFRLNAELGGGYYGAKFEVKSGDTVLYTRSFYNPALRVALSLHWLVFSAVSLGIELNHLQLYDKNQTTGKVTGLVLSAGFVF